jgi:hypothetical protein
MTAATLSGAELHVAVITMSSGVVVLATTPYAFIQRAKRDGLAPPLRLVVFVLRGSRALAIA